MQRVSGFLSCGLEPLWSCSFSSAHYHPHHLSGNGVTESAIWVPQLQIEFCGLAQVAETRMITQIVSEGASQTTTDTLKLFTINYIAWASSLCGIFRQPYPFKILK